MYAIAMNYIIYQTTFRTRMRISIQTSDWKEPKGRFNLDGSLKDSAINQILVLSKNLPN